MEIVVSFPEIQDTKGSSRPCQVTMVGGTEYHKKGTGMGNIRESVLIVILTGILAVNPVLLAAGNPPPDRWEKLAVTKPDSPITIYFNDGSKKKSYRFRSFDSSVNEKILTCADRDKNSVQFRLAEIDKVDLYKRTRYMKLGLIGGLLGGAAIGGLVASHDRREGAVLIVPILAVVGTVSGFAVGGLAGNGETVYITRERALAEIEKRERYPQF